MFGARTLRYYVAKRFVLAIAAAFIVCAALIFMIDMIELLRLSRRAVDLSMAGLFWMALLRLPAFSEILLSFAVLVVPTESANELGLPAVPPQFELVRLDRVDAELRRLTAADVLRPGVAEQAVGKQPEVMRGRAGQGIWRPRPSRCMM